jgi:GTP1/Obg family GTP-binding protein
MKSTERFKNVIEKYLKDLAEKNPQFAQMYSKENKNIDDCITYILNTVQKSGSNGFTQNEIYGMALHYYDEDIIEVGNPIDCQVVVNQKVELTEEEIAEAKEKAIREIIVEEKQRLTKKTTEIKPVAKTEATTDISPNQASLF